MNEQTVRQFIEVRPFEPFIVTLSSGQTHEVKHPENVVLTKTKIVIVNPENDTVVVAALLHITGISTRQAA